MRRFLNRETGIFFGTKTVSLIFLIICEINNNIPKKQVMFLYFHSFHKTVPFVPKTGVSGFFQKAFHHFFDLLLLNLITVLISLPVITSGAALAALCAVTNKMAKDLPGFYVRDYFRFFKVYFKKGTLCGLLSIAGTFIIGFACWFYYHLGTQNFIFYLPAGICAACLILFTGTMCFVFPLLSLQKNSICTTLKTACFYQIVHLPRTALVLLLLLLFLILFTAFFPFSLPFWLICPAGFVALAASCAAVTPNDKNLSLRES